MSFPGNSSFFFLFGGRRFFQTMHDSLGQRPTKTHHNTSAFIGTAATATPRCWQANPLPICPYHENLPLSCQQHPLPISLHCWCHLPNQGHLPTCQPCHQRDPPYHLLLCRSNYPLMWEVAKWMDAELLVMIKVACQNLELNWGRVDIVTGTPSNGLHLESICPCPSWMQLWCSGILSSYQHGSFAVDLLVATKGACPQVQSLRWQRAYQNKEFTMASLTFFIQIKKLDAMNAVAMSTALAMAQQEQQYTTINQNSSPLCHQTITTIHDEWVFLTLSKEEVIQYCPQELPVKWLYLGTS